MRFAGSGPASAGRTTAEGSATPGFDAGGSGGGLAQAASKAAKAIIGALRHDGRRRIKSSTDFRKIAMFLLLLEALGALLLLVFIVWWTMFSGREKGELKDESARKAPESEKEKK